MTPSILLSPVERNTLLDSYRSPYTPPALRLRSHLILLLADGYAWAVVAAILYCSQRTIARWSGRFRSGRIEALLGRPRGAPIQFAAHWAQVVVRWVIGLTPRAFGFLRSRWCCATLALALGRTYRLQISRETVRTWLHQADLVWRRPRPVLKRKDPDRARILGELRQLLRDLPDDETAVFQDEVDINLNPDIGFMGMRRGEQAEVVTPGDNAKNYLAGSLHWRTGTLLAAVRGPKRDGKLVAAHLEELCRRLRRYQVIHVILDNAKIHKCAAVQKVLRRHAGRLQLHYLPKYAPEMNPIERVWWHLREEITRNHTCKTLEELLDLVFAWLADRKSFTVEGSIYHSEDQENEERSAA